MNYNSKLCSYISKHPDTWEDDLKELFIKVYKEDTLAIFNYDIFADFSNPLVKESRGIIIDLETLDVVCFPFNKFSNYNDVHAATIDWNSAKVQEKVDGSIMKLWFDKRANNWRWSSNSMITPDNKFLDMITRCKYPDNLIKMLNKDNTYIFELISPDNQVVIAYPSTKLIHLGTRNNLTGEELDIDLGFEKPKTYALKSEEECVNFAIAMNKNESRVDYEGFVVVDKDYNRVKIKSPDYLLWHRLVLSRQMRRANFLTMIVKTPEKLDDFVSLFKEYEPYIEYYKDAFDKYIAEIDEFITDIRSKYNGNKQEIASILTKSPFKDYGFKALDNTKSGLELFNEKVAGYDALGWNIAPLFYLIPIYEKEDILTMDCEQDIDLD